MSSKIIVCLLVLACFCRGNGAVCAFENARKEAPENINGDTHLKNVRAGLPEIVGGDSASFKPGRVWREILDTVAANFYDDKIALEWAGSHENYAAKASGAAEFSKLANEALAGLKTSHTAYYTHDSAQYYQLLAIFKEALKINAAVYDAIGAGIAPLREGFFVERVFAGGPAEKAGLKRGDRIVSAGGRQFDPYLSFRGQSGKAVELSVERKAGAPKIQVRVTPRRINPVQEWLEYQRLGSKVVERGGKKIAYAPLWSCAGDMYREALEEKLNGDFREADALILDLRGGWGGCNPDFMGIFNPYTPSLVLADRRAGGRRVVMEPWKKPLVLLVDSGTRSGKELVAYSVKKHKLGTLVGERTAGAVMGASPFLLSDNSLLLVASKESLVDGQRLEGGGVEPDIKAEGALPYADGADAQLEKAFEAASAR